MNAVLFTCSANLARAEIAAERRHQHLCAHLFSGY